MIEITDKSMCCGCTACYNVCPQKAIEMKADEKGFLYPYVIQEQCVDCGLCNKACVYQVGRGKKEKTIKAYACYNKNEQVRLNSTSGGIFTLLAEEVLSSGGVVCAALFNEDFMVFHAVSDEKEMLNKFRGSKYIQSNLGDVFKNIKKILQQGRYTLFVGAPCQIDGILNYLGERPANLICIDFICMGVASPKIWNMYLEQFFKGEKIEEIVFKDKKHGWHNYSVKIKTFNKTIYEDGVSNVFMNGYLRKLYYRPSCFSCIFKGIDKKSDLTLSDCWGIEKIDPEMDDNKGISSILVNSEIGNKLMEKIKSKIVWKEIEIDSIVQFNRHLSICAVPNPNEEKFYNLILKTNINRAMNKYCKDSMGVRIKRKLVRNFKFRG